MQTPVLSILVITHNQRELLKRCLSSVLGQKLNVPFEVIVSDDRSDDGTAEYISELQNQITNGELQITNLTQLIYTRCNSNDCNPANVSERCGWNKLNAYLQAKGDYFVNIDADDFLRSNDIYQVQLDILSAHPECSMCMQDLWQINEGDPIEKGVSIFTKCGFEDHHIFTPYEVIAHYRILNQCYMIQRHPEVDCKQLYGKYFDDSIITLHHLQFGSCVFVNRADYVWVRSNGSITKSLGDEDKFFEYNLLPLHHVRFIPSLAPVIMKAGVKPLTHFFKILAQKHYSWQLTERTQLAFSQTPGIIYRIFESNKSSGYDRMRLRYMRLALLLFNRFSFTNWHYLYTIMIGKKEANEVFCR